MTLVFLRMLAFPLHMAECIRRRRAFSMSRHTRSTIPVRYVDSSHNCNLMRRAWIQARPGHH